MRILFITILLSSFLVHSQDLKTASTINEVTLYLQGARIERTASIELKKGTHEIKLSDLSPDIDEASINITDLDGMRLNGLSYSVTALEKKETSNNIKALDTQIAEVKDAIGKLNALNSGLDQERLLLESNRSLNSKDTGLSLAQIKEFGSYYRIRFAAIINERNANNEAITKASEQLNKLNIEKQKLNPEANERRGTITLKVITPSTRRYSINFSYNVYSAGWVPIYDITAQGNDDKINLAFKAQAYQATGTDWKNVKLKISTGDPQMDNQMPQLETKRLGFVSRNYNARATGRSNKRYNPLVKTINGKVTDGSGEPVLGATVLIKGTSIATTTDFDGNYSINAEDGEVLVISFAGYSPQETPIYASNINVTMEESLDAVVISAYRTVKKSRFDYDAEEVEVDDYVPAVVEDIEENIASRTFNLSQLYSIPSTGESTDIEISNNNVDAAYAYYAAPVINENVFLTATLSNWESLNLIPGEANVYFEDAFIGKVYFDTDTTKEELVVGLGVDPQISVKREDKRDFKAKSFFGNNRIVSKNYEITLKNNRNKTVMVKLQDRVPISGNSEIKVDEVETGTAQVDKETQILTWEIDLGSGSQVQEHFSYRVKYPKRRRINLE
ncbi:hypothetical protein BST92_00830 [Nonlabens arenilitoris]|uniref:Energy transducer TonB n=1 Tax=Nonlabens arenilitoris TaxID=1217969 RepID=A0A2S7U6E1_9FLAO|nr:DUF4139 domain-containing protein [Nonlabens arenilitoris]PQJ30569.1 hypothetical protein BST92_00830 [Nonlabens arenilitoris]